MKAAMIILALTLLAGCAVVPAAPYNAYGPYYPSPYYASPVYVYQGFSYYRPLHHGYYGPRYHSYYRGRGYFRPGGPGRYRW